MKKAHWFGLIIAGLLALAGCGKPAAPPSTAPAPYDVQGLKVDLPKLLQEFTSATPDVQAVANQAVSDFRYREYPKVLASLDKLASNPALTEPQKKVVTEVIEQVKQVVAKTGAAR